MIQEYQFNSKLEESKLFIIIKWIFVAVGCYMLLTIVPEQLKTEKAQEDTWRVRVIANSNTQADQAHKRQIAQDVAVALKQLHVDKPADKVKLTQLIKDKYPQTDMNIFWGQHVFPPKLMEGQFTPQNRYHALVVSIGSARGDNWWCTLFKTVCEKDVDENEKKPVKFWLWEWLKDVFS